MQPKVPSPCNDICEMNPKTGYCIGCGRTIDEIVAWPEMTDDQKQNVLKKLDERRHEQIRRV